MDIEGITFIEAVKRLAPRANVDLSHVVDEHPTAERKETATMIAAHELLKSFIIICLCIQMKEKKH